MAGKYIHVAEPRTAQRGEIEVQDKEKGLLFGNLPATASANELGISSNISFYTCTATRCPPQILSLSF